MIATFLTFLFLPIAAVVVIDHFTREGPARSESQPLSEGSVPDGLAPRPGRGKAWDSFETPLQLRQVRLGKIVFASTREGKGENKFDIYTMDADGSNVIRLTNDGGRCPAWSPDGSRIAFDNDDDVYLMNADGSNVTLFKDNAGYPSWSPDGRRIAFASENTFPAGIDVMDLDGKDRKGLVRDWNRFSGLKWHPDGRQLLYCHTVQCGVFVKDASGRVQARVPFELYEQLFVVNVGGGDPEGITSPSPDGEKPREYSYPAYSPDGTRIAACGRQPGRGGNIWIMDPDGSNPVDLTKLHFGRV
jgi:Tol biopolymer transport system component